MSNAYDRGKQYFITANVQRYPAEGNGGGTTTQADGVAPPGTRVRVTRIIERIPGQGGTLSLTDGDGDVYTDHVFTAPLVSAGFGAGMYYDVDITLDDGLGAINSAASNSFYIEYEIER